MWINSGLFPSYLSNFIQLPTILLYLHVLALHCGNAINLSHIPVIQTENLHSSQRIYILKMISIGFLFGLFKL